MARQFDEFVRKIVDDFLQTVVIVDDEALPGGWAEDAEEANESSSDSQAAPGGTGIETLKSPSGRNSDGHDLHAKEVIDAFASQGLICSILDPDEAVEKRLRRTTARADLLVMDWWIHGDRGGRAVELIEEVLKEDQGNASQRLRVIAIYTGQEDLGPVADALEKMLQAFHVDSPLERTPGALSMTKGPIRLTVLAKEHVTMSVPGQDANQVKVSELPGRLAEEFTQLTSGLVSGVALQALAALRKDTHRILDKVGPGLDRGYLGHRVAQARPVDAEDHLTAMVVAEIGSVLADAEIGAKADWDAIRMWLRRARKEGLKPGALFPFKDKQKITAAQIARMLKEGLGSEAMFEAQRKSADRSEKQQKKVRDSATKLFSVNEAEAASGTGSFASRMMLRTLYSNPRRELKLGTIIYRDKKFAMCVQPLCDSVRLPGDIATAFPFLPLEVLDENDTDSRTDLVVPHPLRNEWVRLKLRGKPRSIEMIEFPPSTTGVVHAFRQGTQYRFKSTTVRYRWVADLKPEFAQRFANELGHRFSRIGLDEPELLRLTRPHQTI
jgi:Response receiver domain